MPSPVGLLIGNPKKPWKIGCLIGKGACGSVHELEPPPGSTSTSLSFVAKVAVIPPTTGRTKKKKTPAERNAELIWWEHNIMITRLPELFGNYIPDLPYESKFPPSYGEVEGYRFLAMERMTNPFKDIVKILLQSNAKDGERINIPLGNVATTMLKCISSLHEKGIIYVDVKPENFMLSKNASKSGTKNNDTLSRRIRLIDFGLVELLGDMSSSSHREDMYPGAPVVGTPTYASLNVMTGHTVSARDDLEALGCVLAELVLDIGLSITGKPEFALPWGNAKSEEELCNVKLQEMDESKQSKSTFFGALKKMGADIVMGKYFSIVRRLKFSQKPNYNELEDVLKQLAVSLQGTVSATKARSKVATPRMSPRRKTTRQQDLDDNNVVLGDIGRVAEKKQRVVTNGGIATRRVTRTSAQTNLGEVSVREELDPKPKADTKDTRATQIAPKIYREVSTQTEFDEVISIQSSEKEVEEMDWERINEENLPPVATKKASKALLKLEIVGGPHTGRTVCFGRGYSDILLIGKDPTNSSTRGKMKDAAKLELVADTKASSMHAKVTFRLSAKNAHSLRVDDLKSLNGTFINSTMLGKGKGQQVFTGTKITIGDTVMMVRKG
mmetsp:Transcript_22106/g.46807  ORF Transcript_22106/g.46807 Transcript_22106/m.46807 type:complete len:613 (+) Transcript_22106:184-2022(+)